jgi:ATP-binding protein involved in chromosome partitioning
MNDVDPLRLLQPAATRVRDPVTGRSMWLAGMVQEARVAADGALDFNVVFTPAHAEADRRAMVDALVANLRGLGLAGPVRPTLRQKTHVAAPTGPLGSSDPVPGMSGPGVAPHGGPIRKGTIPGVRHVVAVASGKGGVGKSTVATNLAVAMRRLGWSVGLLDADIYGPSLPLMMNLSDRPMIGPDKKVLPPRSYGVACMSMGLVMEADQAVIWRGPMVMGALRQLLQETAWGELDVLVVDLPPGTGDAQLTLIQAVPISGALIVTTPQEVALADAVRGITMFRKLDVPLLGVVQNMAYYQLPDGTRDYVFGEDGGVGIAMRHGTEVLAELPLRTAIRRGGDEGLPAALGDDDVARVFADLARNVGRKLGLESPG